MKKTYKSEFYQLKPIVTRNGGHAGKLIAETATETAGLQAERRKLYVVLAGKEVWYVGEAHCSMQVRMRRGFTAYRHWLKHKTKRGGYGGYKWIPEFTKKKSARVHVFVFDEKFDDDREAIEAIEGELVFLIRQRTGGWPKYQNEIHFTNSPSAKKVALKIYSEIQVA